MCKDKDYSSELKKKINKYIKNHFSFEYGKSQQYLSHRIGLSIEEIESELKNCKNLVFTYKRETNGEIRYTLYFIYSKHSGRVYVLTFRDKIRVITAFPLGRRTLKKYFRRKFINEKGLSKI